MVLAQAARAAGSAGGGGRCGRHTPGPSSPRPARLRGRRLRDRFRRVVEVAWCTCRSRQRPARQPPGDAPVPACPANDLDSETEATALARFASAAHPIPPCPRRLLERVRDARLQLTGLATRFGAGDLDHAEFLAQRRYLEDDLEQAGRDLTLHNRSRLLAIGPAELSRCRGSLSFRRAVVCALLPFDQTAMNSDAPRRGEADYAST